MNTTQTTTEKPRFTRDQKVTWIQALGGRRRLRSNFYARLSGSVTAKVVSAGTEFVTIEAEGGTHRVKARNLRPEAL